MIGRPLVSIGVPTYNRGATLREGLANIRAQDYRPLEIIISDNASSDETEAICREAASADPRIRYVRQPRNIGLYGNHNACLEESRGEFFCFFHDHDERDPHLVSEYVAFLQQHPEVGVVCSDWELIDEAGAYLGARDHSVQPVTPGLDYIEQTLRSGRSSIGIPGAMVRRVALGDIRFDERGHLGFGDFVVWCHVAEQWAVGHLPKRLWRWRQDPHSQSARTIESLTRDYYENLNAYCDGHLAHWPGHARLVARWRSSIKRYLFWALAYELGLYFRNDALGTGRSSAPRTLFEILGYRLTDQEFQQVLQQLRTYRTGALEYAALSAINGLVRLRFTQPLAWATRHYASFRSLLGLR